MRKSRFSEEQIAMALRQAEAGTPVDGDLPEARGQPGHVLPLEAAVRKPGRSRGAWAAAAAGRESEAHAGGVVITGSVRTSVV